MRSAPNSQGDFPAALFEHWYVACTSRQLRNAPVSRTILGQPVVLFRASTGEAAALLDRCPHRNMPLSAGRRVASGLECGYHGWTFDAGGSCVCIPGLTGNTPGKPQSATSFATREQDGYVWIAANPEREPDTPPFKSALHDQPGYFSLRYEQVFEADLPAVLENILDVPHTAFLHRGLFRGDPSPRLINAHVTRSADRVEASYTGEECPRGLIGRLLAPAGGVIEHTDRFVLGSTAQVEYRLGRHHLLATSFLTPMHSNQTKLYATLSLRSGLPAFLLKPLIAPIAWLILRQDTRALSLQSRNIERFGAKHFSSTEIDLLAPEISRLLQSGKTTEHAVQTKTVQLKL